MAVAAVLVAAVLVAAVTAAAPAGAKAPAEFLFGGTRLTDARVNEQLIGKLCSGDAVAEPVATRPSMPVEVRWSSPMTWAGRYFPATASDTAVIDVPAWRMYGSDRASPHTCHLRAVSPEVAALVPADGAVGATSAPRLEPPASAPPAPARIPDRPIDAFLFLLPLAVLAVLAAVFGIAVGFHHRRHGAALS
jgi:hypothetical protein